MKTSIVSVVVVAVVSIAGAQENVRKIDVTAKKYEFSPARIEVKLGETVELTATSSDAKHGFECKELGVQKVTFEPNRPAVIRFTANRTGTFQFKCANFCGFGHGRMKGEIVVSPN
jgi:cytochrome c oxidase subunit 2